MGEVSTTVIGVLVGICLFIVIVIALSISKKTKKGCGLKKCRQKPNDKKKCGANKKCRLKPSKSKCHPLTDAACRNKKNGTADKKGNATGAGSGR